jgi:bifunctional ADP-heptose synthase (sugar kinase/adenylyltransferase)
LVDDSASARALLGVRLRDKGHEVEEVAHAAEAAEIANYAAGVVVGKLGTATCTQKELIEYMNHE